MFNQRYMTKRIRYDYFPQITFFLSDRVQVDDVEKAAIEHGGATKNLITGYAWSNIAKTDYITANNRHNTLSLFIPSTVDIDQADNNKQEQVIKYISQVLRKKYSDIKYEQAIGTWYSNDLQKVVCEDITIVSINRPDLSIPSINEFLRLAEYIKREMSQEAVSVQINDSLALV